MLSAFLSFMATRNGSNDVPVAHSRASLGASSGEIPRRTGRRAARSRPPQPNHFLSVRIDSAQIWEKVSAVQSGILASNEHLTRAAIPVQDLHLTLFVLTLHEQDGTLQAGKETLEHCGDILLKHGLAPDISSHVPHARASAEALNAGAAGGESGDDKVRIAQEASCLTLSFHGLGNFRDKVLFANLVEDNQADRLRNLVSALHQRFHEAGLVDAPQPRRFAGRRGGSSTTTTTTTTTTSKSGDGNGAKGAGDAYRFEFEPHLTIMKTSKLKDRSTTIPPESYNGDHHRDLAFGGHSPSSLELSSMLEREEIPPLEGWEPMPYYKCQQKLALRGCTT
ncbi:unnamed protein product [Scytosiphon promiscuus]